MVYNDTIQILLDNYSSLRELVEISNSTISNELSSASFHLSMMSFIIAIVGILVGGYVTYLYNKINGISKEIDANLLKVDEAKKQVVDIDTKIQSNIDSLYKQLRDEETRTLFERLVKEPLDIHNICSLLLAREVNESNFVLLKKAYLNLLKSGKENEGDVLRPKNKDSYMLLFFQHFCYQTVLDDDLRDTFCNGFNRNFECAFERDIIKSTEDLCKALSDDNVVFDKEQYLSKYLVALNESRYKLFEDVKEILESQINSKTLLPNAIQIATDANVRLELFNNL